MSAASFTALWGDEHPALGSITTAWLDEHTAMAISPGRQPKPYWHLDPNEDSGLAMGDREVRLIALADGHNGIDAAVGARAGVYEVGDRLLASGDVSPVDVVEQALKAVRSALIDVLSKVEPKRKSSRTALTVALLTPEAAHVATYGDTVAVLVRGDKEHLITEDGPFLGPAGRRPNVLTTPLESGDTIVLATDGITEYLDPNWLRRIGNAVREGTPPYQAARRLTRPRLRRRPGNHCTTAVALVS